MLNHIDIMGRLTKDPELRNTRNDKSVTNFTIACDRDRSDDTDFFSVVAWGKTAEFVYNYFRKGQLVAVAGHVQTRSWEDDNGKKRTETEIVAESVYFAEKKHE